MSEDDGWRRYIEAANALRQLAQARAEEVVRDLLATGETETDHVRQWSDDLLERSRIVVDELVDVVRVEVTRQLDALGLHTPEDLLRRLTQTFARSTRSGGGSAPDPTPPIDVSALVSESTTTASAAKAAPNGRTPSRRAPIAKSAAKKAAPVKKSPTKKSTQAKKPLAKKVPAKKSTAAKSPGATKSAKKPAPKKSPGRGS